MYNISTLDDLNKVSKKYEIKIKIFLKNNNQQTCTK